MKSFNEVTNKLEIEIGNFYAEASFYNSQIKLRIAGPEAELKKFGSNITNNSITQYVSGSFLGINNQLERTLNISLTEEEYIDFVFRTAVSKEGIDERVLNDAPRFDEYFKHLKLSSKFDLNVVKKILGKPNLLKNLKALEKLYED